MGKLLNCDGWCESIRYQEDLTLYNDKNYCDDCLARKEYDDVGQFKLHDQIRKSYGIGSPTKGMLEQSETFREEQGYTYQDQAKAIWYADVIQKIPLNERFKLGIIPYVIKDAVKYYDEQKARIQKENKKKQRLLKCYGWCGKKHPKDELVFYKSKNYCAKCLKRKKHDDFGRSKLYDQIKKSYNIDKPTPFMLKQAKKFREEQGFLYEHQALAIKYADEVEEMPMDVGYGIGIVQIHVQRAVRYYLKEKEKEERLPNYITTAIPKTVKIKKPHHKKHVNRRLVDMDNLLD